MPIAIPFEDTIRQRWIDKPVLAGRLLDDMEDSGRWVPQRFRDDGGMDGAGGSRMKDARGERREADEAGDSHN